MTKMTKKEPDRQPALLLHSSMQVAEVGDGLVLGGELEDALQAGVVSPVLIQDRLPERQQLEKKNTIMGKSTCSAPPPKKKEEKKRCKSTCSAPSHNAHTSAACSPVSGQNRSREESKRTWKNYWDFS